MSRHISLLPDGRSPFLGPIWRPGQGQPMPGLSSASARLASLADIAHNPADLTGVFTTATGTVNAVPGDPVGLILDISKMGGKSAAAYMAANGITDPNACPGVHLRQTTAGARPILARMPKGGRRNLLTWTEDFSNLGWGKTNATPALSGGVWKIIEASATGIHQIYQISVGGAGESRTLSLDLRSAGRKLVQIGGNWDLINFTINLETGVVTGSGGTAPAVVSLPDGWYRITWKGTVPDTVERSYAIRMLGDTGASTYLGDGVSGIEIRYPQLETGSVATPYQKVTNTYDVTETGVASVYALVGDGLSKCMVSDAVNPGTDKVTVVAGVRKLSDDAVRMVLELGTGTGGEATNRFSLFAPRTSNSSFGLQSVGSSGTPGECTPTGYPSPASAVLTGLGDIANDLAQLRVSGVAAPNSGTDQGSGNYGNRQLFLMARNQASLFFNGYWFGDHISWKNHSANDLAFIEKQMAKNVMGVTL